jgi:hypothetical protein
MVDYMTPALINERHGDQPFAIPLAVPSHGALMRQGQKFLNLHHK